MSTPLTRVFESAQCRTQIELAQLLGIRQSSISDAKKRNSIPAEWLVTLLRLRGVNPEWILTGHGPKYLTPTEEELSDSVQEGYSPPQQTKADILRTFSSRDLADELLRRTATSVEKGNSAS